MKRKVIFSNFLLTLLILSFLLISGCSPLDLVFGPSGSINVDTYPSGAKVFLNGGDTGKITPCAITNLIRGSYKIRVTFEDLSYTETVMVYSGCPTSVYKDLIPRLKEIIAKPDILYTKIGETRNISTITAYYYDIDHWPKEIKLSDCSYTKNNDHTNINSEEGTFTGVSKGLTNVAISYTEGEFTESDTLAIFVCITPIYPVSPPEPEPEPEPEPTGKVIIALDNLHQEYYEFLGRWSMVYAYYTIENNSSEIVYDYKIYFEVNCIDDSIYYDSWYEEYTLSPGKSHSDYALIETFGKQADSVKINELVINVYH